MLCITYKSNKVKLTVQHTHIINEHLIIEPQVQGIWYRANAKPYTHPLPSAQTEYLQEDLLSFFALRNLDPSSLGCICSQEEDAIIGREGKERRGQSGREDTRGRVGVRGGGRLEGGGVGKGRQENGGDEERGGKSREKEKGGGRGGNGKKEKGEEGRGMGFSYVLNV